MPSPELDRSHDAGLTSWVDSADGHAEFPIQNLPLGVFEAGGGARGGVAIGDRVLDLAALADSGLLQGEAAAAVQAARGPVLNPWMALPAAARRALRLRLVELLEVGSADRAAVEPMLRPVADCRMRLPAQVGDYTDFYAGIHHALTVGRQFRPDTPLLPNYKYVPIGYHGRASSVRVSGEAVRRPNGQRKPATEAVPTFGPARNLDYELEVGLWVGPGNAPGEAIPIGEAGARIVGVSLLNDWSARDLQGWEYQPLGPFLAKSFATTVSPWVVTAEALAPFRTAQPPRPQGDPAPLPYLYDAADQAHGALAVELEAWLLTPAMAAAGRRPASPVAERDDRHVLDARPAAGAPRLQRLRPAPRRPVGHRNPRRPCPRAGGQPAGAVAGRPRAAGADRRRDAALPGGRRRGDPARPRPARGLRLHRPGRVPRGGDPRRADLRRRARRAAAQNFCEAPK